MKPAPSAGQRSGRPILLPGLRERDLIQRQHDMLLRMSTKRGHLAQRVTHEFLGYCAHNRESSDCVEYRALMEDSTDYLESTAPSEAGGRERREARVS